MSQRVIVYGGRGALGSAAVSAFKKLQWVGIFAAISRSIIILDHRDKL